MRRCGLGFMFLLMSFVITQTATARSLVQHFGANNSCYERQYTGKHLAKNPRQTVSFIRFNHFPNHFGVHGAEGKIGFDEKTGMVAFAISMRFRGSNKTYKDAGECLPRGKRLKCQIECDGGGFEIKHRDANSILILNKTGFAVSGCGEADYGEVTTKTDDKAFLLHRLPASQCKPPKN